MSTATGNIEFGVLPILLIGTILGAVLILVIRHLYLRVTVLEAMQDHIVLRILVPSDNDKSPLAAEQMYASLYGILRGQLKSKHQFSFEIVAGAYGIFFLASINRRYQQFLEGQIYAQYPDAQITEIPDYTANLLNSNKAQVGLELGLTREFYLPLKTFVSFDVDPLASITSAISKLDNDQELFIQFVVRPISNAWQEVGRKLVDSRKGRTDDEGKKVGLDTGETSEMKEIERKSSKLGFQFCIRILAQAPDELTASQLLEDVEASFRQFQTGQFNSLSTKKSKRRPLAKLLFGKRLSERLTIVQRYQQRVLDERSVDIINIEELASLYHLPNTTVEVARIAWAKSRKLPYPMDLPTAEDPEVRVLGMTDYRNSHVLYGLRPIDRRRHSYVLGKTGTGKSTLLKNMIMGDIYAGKGVGVIDPHGDLIEQILELIPAERMQDVVLLDPSDVEFPIGLNILRLKPGEERDIVADGIVEIFKKFFDSWGPRLQYILTNAIVTLLQVQNVSLLAILRLLDDRNYRKYVLKQVKDPILLNFWEREYEEITRNPKMLAETLSPIQNKVGRFVAAGIIRNIVGQVKSSVDLEEIMNGGKIFLINLSQGKIGEENSALLGGMLITRIYTTAMQRVKVPEAERRDFYLYVDEFQNFATTTFVKILSEARKYGLNLTVAHQYIDQLLPEVRDAIFGNVGTVINYVVGPKDASYLEKEYTPYLSSSDLVNLPKYHFVNKITVEGTQTPPFTALAIPPQWEPQGLKEAVIEQSRQAYSTPRALIEDKIYRWAQARYDDKGNLVQERQPGKPTVSGEKVEEE